MKSVNHRFLDIALKTPQALGAIESRLRALVQQRLSRGRVRNPDRHRRRRRRPSGRSSLDEVLLERVAAALEPARARGLITGMLTRLRRAAHSAGARRPRQSGRAAPPRDVSDGWRRSSKAPWPTRSMRWSLMRDTEGRLHRGRSRRAAPHARRIHGRARPARRPTASARSRRGSANGWPGCRRTLPGDAAAVAQEIVRFVARSDIDEEVARLRGHFEHWRAAGRRGRAVRAQARFSGAGDEPRNQHHRLEGRGRPGDRDRRGGQGRARARSASRCRMSSSPAQARGLVVRHLGALRHGQDHGRRAADRTVPGARPVALVHVAARAGERTRWRGL